MNCQRGVSEKMLLLGEIQRQRSAVFQVLLGARDGRLGRLGGEDLATKVIRGAKHDRRLSVVRFKHSLNTGALRGSILLSF